VIINFEAVRQWSRLAPYGSIKLAACRECRAHGNPDLTSTRCEVHPKELNQIEFQVCVLDEAHRVKDPKAKQTRAVWAVFHGPAIKHRYALTGTPLANHPGDLWPIMHAIAPRDFPTKSTYIDRYAMFSWSSNGELEIVGIRGDTKEELFRILDPRFRRVTKDLVLPWLPPKVRTTRQVEMTPKQKKAYVEIEKEAVTKLDDGTLLVLKSNLVGATRLLQLASSYATVEPDGQLELREPSPKLDVLEEVLEEMAGRPVVIAAEHRRLLELASARLEKRQIPHVMFTGGVIEAERALNLKAFNEGQVNVLLFTFKAGGVGIDLSHADTMVRLQRSWSLVDSLQAEDRVHRIGSERHEAINIIDLITTDTIEVEQVKRLYTKLERLEEIVRDRERRIRAGLTVDELDAEASVIMNTWLGDAA
jgi:SNF2 family DNA or RNA helicase